MYTSENTHRPIKDDNPVTKSDANLDSSDNVNLSFFQESNQCHTDTDNDSVNTSNDPDTACDRGTLTSENNLGTGTVWKTTNDFQGENSK